MPPETKIDQPQPSASNQPGEGLRTAVSPSGIEIGFETEPKRQYYVRSTVLPGMEWEPVPSVTQVLDVLAKPALTYWGMKVGVAGMVELWQRQNLWQDDFTGELLVNNIKFPSMETTDRLATPENCVQALVDYKLTVNHQRDKAADRGSRVHDAFEEWAKTEKLPDPEDFDESEKGYVRGLRKFLDEVQPRPRACEVMVGSLEHGYAGRYDLRALVERPRRVCYRTGLKRGDKYALLQPGNILIDLKTSKGVYDSHSLQLEAYEQASVECGYEPTDARGILHVTEDGGYEFVRSVADFTDFENVLNTYRSLESMKTRKVK